MTSAGANEAIIVVCTQCRAANRVPRARLADGGTCGRCGAALFAGAPATLDAPGLEAHLRRDGLPLLVDFWAPWCGPCRQMAPAFAEAARLLEPHVRLAKLDTEAHPAAAARHSVQSIPTLILFAGGREIARQAGAMPAHAIAAWTRRALG